MLRVCLAAFAATLSDATEAVSLLQVSAEKRQVGDASCKEMKKAFKDAKKSYKNAKKEAKEAREILKARKNAKEAYLLAKQSMEEACPAPEAESDPNYIPSCNRGQGQMKPGVPDWKDGSYRAQPIGFETGGAGHQNKYGCASHVYHSATCYGAVVAFTKNKMCYCATPAANVVRKFLTKERLEEQGYTGWLIFADREWQVSSGHDMHACWIDDAKKGDFSVSPGGDTAILPCRQTGNSWSNWAQEDDKKFMVGNTGGGDQGKWACVKLAQSHPKCRWATRASMRTSGDCYCEWGQLTKQTVGIMQSYFPDWLKQAWGSVTCVLPDVIY